MIIFFSGLHTKKKDINKANQYLLNPGITVLPHSEQNSTLIAMKNLTIFIIIKRSLLYCLIILTKIVNYESDASVIKFNQTPTGPNHVYRLFSTIYRIAQHNDGRVEITSAISITLLDGTDVVKIRPKRVDVTDKAYYPTTYYTKY